MVYTNKQHEPPSKLLWFILFIKVYVGPEEVAVFTALAEDLSSEPSTHMVAYNYL